MLGLSTLRTRSQRVVSTSALETLEHRRLLAGINVADFGALPNDGVDDTGAIRAALSASKAGDTLNFAPGVYNVSDTITMRSHREIKGWGGATIKRSGKGYVFANDQQNYNITYTDMTFDGGGIDVSSSTLGEAVLVRGNTFQNISGGWPTGDGIYAPSGLKNSKITRNIFLNISGPSQGIYGFNTFTDVEISSNYFDGVWEGIHLAYEKGGSNLKVINNTGINWTRMPIELQGKNAVNTIVEGNYFNGWKSTYDGSFALSIMNYGEGTIIRNNVLIGPGSAPVGIEVGGRNGLVEGNSITGFREGMHLVGSSGTVVRKNVFLNQSLVSIWRTGVDEAYNLNVNNNYIKGSPWAFLFTGGRTDGSVFENNFVTEVERGIVGSTAGVTIGANNFQKVKSIR